MTTILVIEDEKEIAENIKSILKKDYDVLTVFSGKDGLDIISKETISLVVLDYMLPDIDGLEVLRTIKENYKIPVIMITAYGNKEVVLKSWRYKADYYFDKPFSLKALREKAREILEVNFPFESLGLDPSRLSRDTRVALEFIFSYITGSRTASKKITIEEISAITEVSPKYLPYLFKKECGKSIYNIISILKIEKAKKLLSDKERDIKEIALELGFNRPHNFSRFFRNLTGKSPSEVRNK